MTYETLRSYLGRACGAETVDGDRYLVTVFERLEKAGPAEQKLAADTTRVAQRHFPEARGRYEEDFALLRPASWSSIPWEEIDRHVDAHYASQGLSCALGPQGYEVTGVGVRKRVTMTGSRDLLVQVADFSVEKRN